MSDKHTPGPWFIEAQTKGHWNPMILAGADTIGAHGYESGIASVVGRVTDVDANAQLIASAPDLLEALERTFADLGLRIGDHVWGHPCDPEKQRAVLQMMQDYVGAAIAKARVR